LRHSYSLGVDVGSVSTNLVLVDENNEIVNKLYLRTSGRPIEALAKGLDMIAETIGPDDRIVAAGTTGSGRRLAGVMIGADVVKNEITAHAVAACLTEPSVQTILEIGGQDSKLILLRDGVVYDFAMNTVCAAGTGSFLDRQAARLEIPIEEFGAYALKSRSPVRIAGRCAVFAESDMVHKQQTGHGIEDIIAGLCEAMARNFLNNLAKGKKILEPVVFQGGVAANVGMVAAFEKLLGVKLIIPKHYDVMGAYGAALLAREETEKPDRKTTFCGIENIHRDFSARSMECNGCPNMCELVSIFSNGRLVAHWGNRCDKAARDIV
jgi:predicted CoA-substrate-specific enzyme activase